MGAQLDDTNGSFLTRIRRADLWMIAVLIEHCVLACKFLVKVILPEEPEWVASAKAALEYRQELMEGVESLMPRSVQVRPARCLLLAACWLLRVNLSLNVAADSQPCRYNGWQRTQRLLSTRGGQMRCTTCW